ncbi:hypothetical protein [Promicromonospora panici]|uniref:hypothetical protein n=1 Tax=Promicromonospora panici TaxID=2219658 RepID=UPI00101CF690|nr:hypothetical protein [Promicromonospora panici]
MLASGVLALTLAACATGSSGDQVTDAHAPRVKLYDSVADLAADSGLVVTGQVVDQTTATDIDDVSEFTLSTFEISTVIAGAADVAGQQVVVRQHGSAEHLPPAPLLEKEGAYLLYLTPSGLDGELAKHYYITGANAGMYQATGSLARTATDTFTQIAPEEGENLRSNSPLWTPSAEHARREGPPRN